MKLKIVSVLILCCLLIISGKVAAEGKLFLGGGALQDQNQELWEALHDSTGKDKPVVAVFCSAEGSLEEAKEEYYENTEKYLSWENLFRKYNFKPFFIPIAIDNSESAAFDKDNIEKVSKADVIWFNGGNQNLHVDSLLDEEGNPTPLMEEVYRVYKNGAIIGGTSAGTAIMSNPMIGAGQSLGALLDGTTNKDNYSDSNDNRVFLRNGFNFCKEGIVDQHFLKRGRLGRLVRAVVNTDKKFGIGVDENTAALINDNEISVYGKSGVIIIDCRDYNVQQNHKIDNIKLHYLTSGDKMNLITGDYTPHSAKDLSLVGNEYYTGNQLNSNIFGKDAVRNMITQGLLDNTEKIAQGIAFRMISDSSAEGVKVLFHQVEETSGYFGKVKGENKYSIFNIELEIIPIEITISIN